MDAQKRKYIQIGFLIFSGVLALVLILGFSGRTVPADSRRIEDAVPSVLAIYTVEEYLDFAESVRSGNTYKGQYVNLYTDLDFAGVTEDLTAGNEENTQCRFMGVFDGNAHRIQNLNIQSDSEAGLFRNLEGTICNLQIDSGNLSGEICGAIASSMDQNARVINCASYAQIVGNTIDGLVGEAKGIVDNCVSAYEEKEIDFLNQGLCGLGGTYEADAWHFWEMEDGKVVLSSKTANTLTSISTEFYADMEKITLNAYYSRLENAWCFAMPAGYEGVKLPVMMSFSNGEQRNLYRDEGISELICEMDSISYPVKFLAAEHVPAMMIHISGTDALSYLHEDKENRRPGTFFFLNPDGRVGERGGLDEIRGHGNDSWGALKKSYNLTFREEEDLYQIGASRNYVLLAAYRDNSLLTYKVTHDLCRELEMDFAPRSQFVHLYVDGVYLGMYLLTGKIEVGEDRFAIKDQYTETCRVNVQPIKKYERQEWRSEETEAKRIWFDLGRVPEDVTGGYILEMDNEDYDRYKSRFVSDRNLCIVLRSLPYASREQVDYIADLWQDFEDALYSEDGYNGKRNYYTDYVDLKSFADQWLLYEFNEEPSVNSSVYFYKDSDMTGDGRIHASWCWDMEHSLARSGGAASSWFAGSNVILGEHWLQFYRHRDFAEAVYQEWIQRFVPALEKALQEGSVQNPDGLSSLEWYLEEYGQDGALNHSRWPDCDFQNKLDKIQYIYTVRKAFLTKALALYDTGYQYFYEEEGVFYGVTDDWEAVPIEGVDSIK